MECYQRNQPVVDHVWSRIQRRLRGYPPPLRRLAAELAKSFGPAPRRYFSGADASPLLHLPIWLAQPARLPALPDLLEATALAYLHVRIQDNVVDEPAGRGKPPCLLLGNVLLADAIALLAEVSKGERFWRRARAAWQLFASETEAERAALARGRGYSGRLFRRHARKVALARIPLYAVLAWQRKDDARHLALVDRLVDRLGEAYGLVNDVLGCSRDLAAGTPTYLLTAARALLPRAQRNDRMAVQNVLVTTPLFERFLTRAMRAHRRALPDGEALGIRVMADYTEERVRRIEHHVHGATTLRLALALARGAPSK